MPKVIMNMPSMIEDLPKYITENGCEDHRRAGYRQPIEGSFQGKVFVVHAPVLNTHRHSFWNQNQTHNELGKMFAQDVKRYQSLSP